MRFAETPPEPAPAATRASSERIEGLPADPLPAVMSLRAAAAALDCSTRTLRRAIDAGELRASRLAQRGCWVVQRDDLMAWIDARARPTARPINPLPAERRARIRRPIGAPGPLSAKLKEIGTTAC
jgi:excisionase family DNA binding protein